MLKDSEIPGLLILYSVINSTVVVVQGPQQGHSRNEAKSHMMSKDGDIVYWNLGSSY